eukprot:2471260-Prymnesium_polylepis.1
MLAIGLGMSEIEGSALVEAREHSGALSRDTQTALLLLLQFLPIALGALVLASFAFEGRYLRWCHNWWRLRDAPAIVRDEPPPEVQPLSRGGAVGRFVLLLRS